MQVIDFINKRGYEVISFPDGEKHLKINQLDRKEDVEVICRITNSDELFLLMQLSDILNRQCVRVSKIYISYLMSMRCDRLFSLEQPFSLRIVSDVINSFNAETVYITEPHSNATLSLIKNSVNNPVFFVTADNNFVFCFPDSGAIERNKNSVTKHRPIKCNKKRDVSTGQIIGINIEDSGDYAEGMDIVVIDDLCDGGSTFLGIESELRKLNPKSITLAVTHAVQKRGIERVADVYDMVVITNSYKDWNDEVLPKNVTVISWE